MGVLRQGQDDVGALDTAELVENRARAISESGAGLPLLKSFPQHVGEEAHQDVGPDAVCLLVPDRADRQLALVDPEGGLGLAELHVGAPQRLDVPVPDVGAQHVAPLAVSGPLVPLGADRPLQAKPRGTRGVPEDADGVARGRAAVAPQEPPDLSFETRVLQRFARARDARPELAQGCFNPLREALVHRLFLSRRSTERHSTNVSAPSGPAHSFASTPSLTLFQFVASAISPAHLRSSLFAGPVRYARPVPCSHETCSVLIIPRAMTQTRLASP